MKKFFLFLILISISFGIAAQTNGHVNIFALSINSVELDRNPGVWRCSMCLSDEGVINYYGGNYYKGVEKSGQYYIKDGTIYITWSNGHKETAKITYSSDGYAVITYNNNKIYEKNAQEN